MSLSAAKSSMVAITMEQKNNGSVAPPEALASAVKAALQRDGEAATVQKLQLSRIAQRVQENYRGKFEYDPGVVKHVVSRCTEVESGARNVDLILSGTMLPQLSAEFLSRMSAGEPVKNVKVSVDDSGAFRFDIG